MLARVSLGGGMTKSFSRCRQAALDFVMKSGKKYGQGPNTHE
jgi:hypothetical protein